MYKVGSRYTKVAQVEAVVNELKKHKGEPPAKRVVTVARPVAGIVGYHYTKKHIKGAIDSHRSAKGLHGEAKSLRAGRKRLMGKVSDVVERKHAGKLLKDVNTHHSMLNRIEVRGKAQAARSARKAVGKNLGKAALVAGGTAAGIAGIEAAKRKYFPEEEKLTVKGEVQKAENKFREKAGV